MTSNTSLLDIDRGILERNLLLTESTEDELHSLFPVTSSDQDESRLVKPSPGFCVKTHTKDGVKVFINVCQTDAIPPPEDISEDGLIEILQSETPSSYRVPMSIGEAHTESDKTGNPVTVYDIAINPSFFDKIDKSELFKEFFLTVVTQGVQDKYNVEFDEKFIILKNKKCMGTLKCHRIRKREVHEKMGTKPAPLIQELDGRIDSVPSTSYSQPVRSVTTELKSKTKGPEYRLIREPKTGDIEYIIGEFRMPDAVSSRDIALDVGEDRIILEVRRQGYLLDVFVPHSINQQSVGAQLNKQTGILTVTMPILQSS